MYSHSYKASPPLTLGNTSPFLTHLYLASLSSHQNKEVLNIRTKSLFRGAQKKDFPEGCFLDRGWPPMLSNRGDRPKVKLPTFSWTVSVDSYRPLIKMSSGTGAWKWCRWAVFSSSAPSLQWRGRPCDALRMGRLSRTSTTPGKYTGAVQLIETGYRLGWCLVPLRMLKRRTSMDSRRAICSN